MSRYIELSPTTYLAWYKQRGLDDVFQTTAEGAADAWLDQQFARWDRSGWTLGLPGLSQVRRAGELYGASEYVLLDFGEHRPDVTAEAGEALRMRAQALVDDMTSNGLYDDTGTLIPPVGGTERGIPIQLNQ